MALKAIGLSNFVMLKAPRSIRFLFSVCALTVLAVVFVAVNGTKVSAFDLTNINNSAIATPTITSVTPNSGFTNGTTNVTITGTNLTSPLVVRFGGVNALSFTGDSPTQISASTPAHAAGPVSIEITTTTGNSTTPSVFTYIQQPSITLDTTGQTFGTTGIGTPSLPQTKAISGSNLTGNIGCTPLSSTNYQLSSDGTNWGTSATFTQSGGNASGTLYVRFLPQAAGTLSTNIFCSTPNFGALFFGVSGTSVAANYRYGHIYWDRDFNAPSPQTKIDFTVEAGFRMSDLGTPTVGQLIDLGLDFNYGDNTTEDARFQVTAAAPSLDIVYGRLVKANGTVLTHTYPATVPASYIASWQGGRRLPTSINFSSNDWLLKDDVVIKPGVTKSSRSFTITVISVYDDEVSQIQIPTLAFDNFTNRLQVGTQADFFLTTTNPTGQILPPGMSLDTNTGVVTWDIRDSLQPAISAGQEYYFAVRIITYDVINNVNVMSSPLEVMFKVGAPRPVVTTDTATTITTTTATLNGSVNPRGTAAFGYFRYSTTDPFNCGNFGTGTNTVSQSLGSGSSPIPFTQTLSSLPSNTTYYYCAFATQTPGGPIVSYGNPRQSFVTAAPITHVNISGRVTALSGRGVTNATVRISGGSLPAPVTVITGRLGNYSFANLPVNQTYTVTVNARRFTFSPSSRGYTPTNNVTNADFVAQQ